MAKYCGQVGFAETSKDGYSSETSPGVWKESITERTYYGDFNRNIRRLQSSGNQIDNLAISNEISIVADPYAYENFHAIRYATYMGTKWKVSSITVEYPRLTLSLEGIYNA